MRYHVLAVPALGGAEALEELNRFLAEHQVVQLERRLVEAGEQSYWSFCIGYAQAAESGGGVPAKRGRIDYRELLSPADFAVYSKLRELRRDLAQREGLPPYGLFTNEQLAAMVTGRVTSQSALAAIEGVGPARLEKYGEAFMARLKSAFAQGAEAPAGDGAA